MATLFAGDESGNLGFDFSHGGTQYFVMALVRFDEPDQTRERIRRFRSRRGLMELEISFHDISSRQLKEKLFGFLMTLPFVAWVLVVRKHDLADLYAVMPKNTLYALFLGQAIAEIPLSQRERRNLILDEFDQSGRVLLEVNRVTKSRGIRRGFKKIIAKRSSSETLIQVADLIAGAVLGKYAKGDDRYFRLIQDRLVVAEFPKQQKPPS